MTRTSTCKSEACGATIQWARNVDTGKGMPLDPTPVPDGNVVVHRGEHPTVELRSGEWPVRVLGDLELSALGSDTLRYQAHFRSCVDAASFRTQRAGHGRDRRR